MKVQKKLLQIKSRSICMTANKIVIINNEKCFEKDRNIYCQNIEIKSLAEILKYTFDLYFILRRGKINPIHKISSKKIYLTNSYFDLFSKLSYFFKQKKNKYLIISITPFTFFAFILISLSGKKCFLYLRSDGREEFKYIFGFGFVWIYKLMLFFMAKYCTIIAVNKLIYPKKFFLALPSQIDKDWLKNSKRIKNKKLKLLYVGRIKVEKGVYSLLKLFNKIQKNISATLTLVGHGDELRNLNKNIKHIQPTYSKKKLIEIYDKHDIVILPSFTEGHPQVLLESLARKKPIIIFSNIAFVKKDFNNVFVSERNQDDFNKTITYIKKNFKLISKDFKKNKIPTKINFKNQLIKILNQSN